MSIAEIGSEFKFICAELVEHSYMRPLSDWRNGDPLQVVAHVKMYGSVSALYWNTRDLSSSTVRDDLLEEVPDARETAIREVMDIADVDCRVTAARLVGAGFKRELVL